MNAALTNVGQVSTSHDTSHGFTDEITGPRRKLGKWAKTVVPLGGWRCTRIVAREHRDHTCDMCEAQYIQYVHWMEHDDYPHVLKVGCYCAGRLELDRHGAEDRERMMKNRAARRAKWLTRRWKVSRKGNAWLRTAGYCITVWPRGTGWSFTIAPEDAATHHEGTTFSTVDQAKLAAFDFIWPAESRVM
jgi:hypothetical protein